MTSPPVPPMTEQDAEHLRLLSIFQYIVGGMQGLVGCFPIFHFLFGAAVAAGVTAAMCMPFGTVLGVFTILVLARPAVKAAFEAGRA